MTTPCIYTDDHIALQDYAEAASATPRSTRTSTNGRRAEIFPAQELFRKMGKLGFLGVNKPVEYGGQGLDYSFAAAIAEGLCAIQCGGVPMAIGVQTDMATPALARFGSDELRKEFLAPVDRGEYVALPRRVRSRRRLRRGVDQDACAQGRRRLRDQRRQDVDHQRHAGRLVLRARQHLATAAPRTATRR